jgi:hypothetical protein
MVKPSTSPEQEELNFMTKNCKPQTKEDQEKNGGSMALRTLLTQPEGRPIHQLSDGCIQDHQNGRNIQVCKTVIQREAAFIRSEGDSYSRIRSQTKNTILIPTAPSPAPNHPVPQYPSTPSSMAIPIQGNMVMADTPNYPSMITTSNHYLPPTMETTLDQPPTMATQVSIPPTMAA